MVSDTQPNDNKDSLTAKAIDTWEVEVFYDGECPLCIREIDMLRWMDRKQRIRFTDISVPEFDAAAIGRDMSTLMAEIHGRLPDGRLIAGVEVFRRLYAAVGLSPLVAVTRLPLISHGLEFGYRVFARNRLRFTGRFSGDTCKADVSATYSNRKQSDLKLAEANRVFRAIEEVENESSC